MRGILPQGDRFFCSDGKDLGPLGREPINNLQARRVKDVPNRPLVQEALFIFCEDLGRVLWTLLLNPLAHGHRRGDETARQLLWKLGCGHLAQWYGVVGRRHDDVPPWFEHTPIGDASRWKWGG